MCSANSIGYDRHVSAQERRSRKYGDATDSGLNVVDQLTVHQGLDSRLLSIPAGSIGQTQRAKLDLRFLRRPD